MIFCYKQIKNRTKNFSKFAWKVVRSLLLRMFIILTLTIHSFMPIIFIIFFCRILILTVII